MIVERRAGRSAPLALGRTQRLDPHAADLAPGTGIWRQAANVIVHVAPRFRPIDARLVLGNLGRSGDARLRLWRERQRAALRGGQRAQHQIGAEPRQRIVQVARRHVGGNRDAFRHRQIPDNGAGVEPFVHLHDGDAACRIARHDGAVDRRGAAPINRAIMAGDAASGVTIMQMDEGLDTGAIVRNLAMAERVAIAPDMTAGDLHDALARLGADLMLRALAAAERGSLSLTPQPEAGVTTAAKISKDETRIDWTKPWRDVHNHIRGLSPYPGAWCEICGVRVKALRSTKGEGGGAPGTALDDHLTIACGDGAVRLTQVQRAGRQPMAAEEFLRGTKGDPGARLA